MRIHILDPLIANQIAAGEVIERPASIIKELLENSLDAGATRLMIDIERGGRQLIRISDNGCGIERDDLPLAVQRHGTSKIKCLDDLSAIESLGFRGEALASICAVSSVEISSCVAGADHAWQLTAEGTDSEVLEKPVAHPVGTTITVRNLFFNTPARRKFLRTERTEFSYIEALVKKIALSHFNLQIELTHDQRRIIQLAPAPTEIAREKRIAQICGKGFIDYAVRFDKEATGLRLWGWIALPQFSRAQSDLQFLYINGRTIRDKLLNHAIRQAWQQAQQQLSQNHLDAGRYPAYILFLECDPKIIDVNVHPTKHEVRFREGRLIHDFVFSSLKSVLDSENEFAEEILGPITTSSQQDITPDYFGKNNNVDITTYKNAESETSRHKVAEPIPNYSEAYSADLTTVREERSPSFLSSSTSSLSSEPSLQSEPSTLSIISISFGKTLACLKNQFILAEQDDGLVIINIKSATQLIVWYEFNRGLKSNNIKRETLLFPVTINLKCEAFEKLFSKQQLLNELGFCLDSMGEGVGYKQMILRDAPPFLKHADFALLFSILAGSLENDNERDSVVIKISELAPTVMNRQFTLASMDSFLRKLEMVLNGNRVEKNSISPFASPLPYRKLNCAELEKLFC